MNELCMIFIFNSSHIKFVMQAPKRQNTQMQKKSFGWNMILFVVGQRLETLNI
jgi:hypothetical protein